MSFQTSYIYDLVDKISPKLQKVNSSLQKTATQARKTAEKASNSFKKFSQSLDKTIQKASRLGKSLFLRLQYDRDWETRINFLKFGTYFIY